jgi:hypothetical protein
VGERLVELEGGLEIWRVDIDEAREQDVNARAMSPQVFERLSKTIESDRRMESLPFLAVVDDHMEIVSGHHRVRAARTAGLPHYFALVDVTKLPRDRVRSKQLAHNAIQGTDEAELVARIYRAIEDVDARVETALDPAVVEKALPKVSIPQMDLGVGYRTVSVMFLPYQLDRFEAIAAKVFTSLSKADRYWVADLEALDKVQAVLRKVSRVYDVRAMGAVFERMGRLVDEALGNEVEGEDVVPLRDLLGTSVLPAEAAAVIRAGLERMEKAGDVTKAARWRAVEMWAADYLGGPDPESE